jgi:thiol-disulfide isomerase/thioredoxin
MRTSSFKSGPVLGVTAGLAARLAARVAFCVALGMLAGSFGSTAPAFAHAGGSELSQGTPPPAAPPAAAASVDVGGLLISMRKALENTSQLSYDAVVYGSGTIAASMPKQEATVRAARLEGDGTTPGAWRLSIQGENIRIGYDGLDARSIREKESSVVEKTPTDLEDLAVFFSTQGARHPIAWELFATTPFPVDITSPKVEGTATVDGVECTVLTFPVWKEVTGPAPLGIKAYVGPDALVRRIDRLLEGGARVVELRSLKVNSEAQEGEYSLSIPGGYRVRAAESNKPKKEAPKQSAETGLLAVGSDAPGWELRDPDGTVHKLSDQKGKLVLMDFWATWCGPCKLAMPGVQKLHEKHKDHVRVFGVNFAESGDPAGYMQKKNFTYTLLLKAEDVASDYKVSGIPAFYLLDGEGKVLYAATGYSPQMEKTLEAKITEALAGK